MGRRKSQKSSEPISPRFDGDTSESGRSRDTSQVPEKKQCIHINKAVDQNDIRKHFKTSDLVNHLKCVNCDSQKISVCLKCGVSLCMNEHAKKHEQTPRSDLHCLMLDTNHWTIWCFKCNASIQTDANKKLRFTGDYVKSHFAKTPTPIVNCNMAIPLGPPPPPPLPSPLCDKNNKVEKSSPMKSNTKSSNNTTSQNKIRGLVNLGNTCFFNSVLQCLAQTPNLVEYLNELKNDEDEFTLPPINDEEDETVVKLGGWGPLTQELARTLSEMKSNSGTVFSPRPLLEHLREKCSQFRGYEQHDAHELLRELLNAVRTEDLKRYQKVLLLKLFKTTKFNPKYLNDEEKAKAKQLYQKISDMVATKPINIFKGQTECVHECQDCHYRSPKIEPFMDLSLPVLSEKPQPPSCKKNRGDSTSEEPKLSKYEQKKLRKQNRQAKKNSRCNKNNNSTNSNYEKVSSPNTDKYIESNENHAMSDDIEKNKENFDLPYCSQPRRQESGYNSDKLVSPSRSNSPALIHTAENFMDFFLNPSNCINRNSPISRSKSASSLDEDFEGPPALFNDIDTATSKLNLNTSSSNILKDLDNSATFLENERFNKFNFEVTNYSTCQNKICSETLEKLPISSNKEIESIRPEEIECNSSAYFNDLNYHNSDTFDRKVDAPNFHNSVDNLCEVSGTGSNEITMDSIKQNAHLHREEVSSLYSTRSSSLFQESGFGSQSIDEVSSTHPSEGMCATTECYNGVPSIGDEFYVENKTSIPESGIGSMTEELPVMSILESDGEANASPDSMHANRSSGSIHTLSPFSDDSSQKKNPLRSCNSLSNSSGEDLSCCQQDHSPSIQHCLDHIYIAEKLNGRISRRGDDCEDEDEEVILAGDDEDEREENNEIEETKQVNSEIEASSEDDNDNNSHKDSVSVGDGTTLLPKILQNEGECSLLSCLNQYTSIELLAGNNKVTCERCTREHNRGTNKKDPVKTAASLQTLIVLPPSVLICHLKRFQLTYSSLKKISKSVPFPLTLSLGSFCSSKCQNIEEGQKDVQYSLYGVVEHSGSLHGGHYVAYVKTSSGQWYYASDSRVSMVPESTVRKSEAYLLFYHRIC